MAAKTSASQPTSKKKGIIQEFVGFAATAIIIMIVLVVFVFPMFYGSSKERKLAAKELEAIAQALTEYRSEKGGWPGTTNVTASTALTVDAANGKPWLSHERQDKQGRLLDPWDKPYQFFLSNDGFIVRSSGPDAIFNAGSSENLGDDLVYFGK